MLTSPLKPAPVGRAILPPLSRAPIGSRGTLILTAFLMILSPVAGSAESTPQAAQSTDVPAGSSSTRLTSSPSPAPSSDQPLEASPGSLWEDEEAPVLSLPDPPTAEALARVPLPARPYSIYIGSFREISEAEATLREFKSRGLPAYLLPVHVRGPIAQSLYGVSQDGLWYRIFVGHYSSPGSARKTLKFIMEKLSTYQPEILKLSYALECARVLEGPEAEKVASELAARGLHPYLQTWQADQDRTLYRVLLGCSFSKAAALSFQREVEAKGVSCKAVER